MSLAMRRFGLPMAMLRHAIIFALSAGSILVQALVLKVPIDAQFSSWLFVAVGVGALSAVLAPRAIGLVFVVAGMTVGLLAVFAIQVGSTHGVEEVMLRAGILYLEIIEVAALAYLLVAIALTLIARRR